MKEGIKGKKENTNERKKKTNIKRKKYYTVLLLFSWNEMVREMFTVKEQEKNWLKN